MDDWIGFMQILLDGVEPGQKYVYFDGYIIPTTSDSINVEGLHSQHNLDFVPQVEAMTNTTIRDDLLCSREYWQSNRVKE